MPLYMDGNNVSVFSKLIVEGGSGGSEKYGATANTFLGDVNDSGVLYPATEESDVVFTGVKDVRFRTLYYVFREKNIKSLTFPDATQMSGSECCHTMCENCEKLQTISFPELITLSGQTAFRMCFNGCENLTSINFPKLEAITGNQACYNMFKGCEALTSVEFPELTTISGSQACYGMFNGCISLRTVSFPKLSTLSGSNCLTYLCQSCNYIEHIYFNALNTSSFGSTTGQLNNLIMSTSNYVTHTIHFPSNMENTIKGLSGYPNFGGTSGYVVLAFDLPATS